MPHVSKKKISEEIFRRILKDLVTNVERADDTRDALTLVYGLLTKTERIMLAKRLAAVHLLSRGYPTCAVSDVLGLSTSTTLRFRNSFEFKRVARLIDLFAKKKVRVWRDIENMLRVGLPPVGRGRWI